MAASRVCRSDNSRITTGISCTWASWAARQRRSPATISNSLGRSGWRRTRIGWRMPLAAIDSASDCSDSAPNSRRGWKRLGCRCSVATDLAVRTVSSAAKSSLSSPNRAARPRPRLVRLFGSPSEGSSAMAGVPSSIPTPAASPRRRSRRRPHPLRHRRGERRRGRRRRGRHWRERCAARLLAPQDLPGQAYIGLRTGAVHVV